MLSRMASSSRRAGAVLVAMEPDRGLADALDQIEHVGALLVADGVAEDASEQADVVPQPGVLLQRLHVFGPVRPEFSVGRHGLKGHGGALQKLPGCSECASFLPQRKMKMEARCNSRPHDEKNMVFRPRGAWRPSFGQCRSLPMRGRREDRMLVAPVECVERDPQVKPERPGLPCAIGLRLIRALLGVRAF